MEVESVRMADIGEQLTPQQCLATSRDNRNFGFGGNLDFDIPTIRNPFGMGNGF